MTLKDQGHRSKQMIPFLDLKNIDLTIGVADRLREKFAILTQFRTESKQSPEGNPRRSQVIAERLLRIVPGHQK